MEKFSTLGLSMWSLILHGTLLDGIADILEEMKDLEDQGLKERPWNRLRNGRKNPRVPPVSPAFRPLLEPFRQL